VKDSADVPNGAAAAEEPSSVSSSLLERLKVKSPEAWRRLIYLFGPVVYQRCRQHGLQPADASDVFQDVFRAVATDIGSFRRDQPGDTFRGWLWTITRNKLADFWGRRQEHPQAPGGSDALENLTNLPAKELAKLGDSPEPETPGSLYRRALQLVQAEFEERTWKAFWGVAVDGRAPADMADELGMSLNAVYIAKTRVLRRLRQELGDLLD
jgi:RNA polymerase sigma-70 factor (ECF subfamily)